MSAPLTIKWKKIHTSAKIPHKAYAGDAGFDLGSIEEIHFQPFETKKIPTGLCMELPPKHYVQTASRSGWAFKDLVALQTILDEGYRGHVKPLMRNIGPHPLTVPKGARFCQLVLKKVVECISVEVSELSPSERGTRGLGSTGEG